MTKITKYLDTALSKVQSLATVQDNDGKFVFLTCLVDTPLKAATKALKTLTSLATTTTQPSQNAYFSPPSSPRNSTTKPFKQDKILVDQTKIAPVLQNPPRLPTMDEDQLFSVVCTLLDYYSHEPIETGDMFDSYSQELTEKNLISKLSKHLGQNLTPNQVTQLKKFFVKAYETRKAYEKTQNSYTKAHKDCEEAQKSLEEARKAYEEAPNNKKIDACNVMIHKGKIAEEAYSKAQKYDTSIELYRLSFQKYSEWLNKKDTGLLDKEASTDFKKYYKDLQFKSVKQVNVDPKLFERKCRNQAIQIKNRVVNLKKEFSKLVSENQPISVPHSISTPKESIQLPKLQDEELLSLIETLGKRCEPLLLEVELSFVNGLGLSFNNDQYLFLLQKLEKALSNLDKNMSSQYPILVEKYLKRKQCRSDVPRFALLKKLANFFYRKKEDPLVAKETEFVEKLLAELKK